MHAEVPMRPVLIAPPGGVDFGIQQGRGSQYETLYVQQGHGGDVTLDFPLRLKDPNGKGPPDFEGPVVQGPPGGRFVYVDVGTYAGQKNTTWSRRMKIPLEGITWTLIREVLGSPGLRLSARVAGRTRDGGPNCASVKPHDGWRVAGAIR
jgi:hypothetical protein